MSTQPKKGQIVRVGKTAFEIVKVQTAYIYNGDFKQFRRALYHLMERPDVILLTPPVRRYIHLKGRGPVYKLFSDEFDILDRSEYELVSPKSKP